MESSVKKNSLQERRDLFLKEALSIFASASHHAEAGDLEGAGELILKALDQERRAAIVGPQVLQLIKPRD